MDAKPKPPPKPLTDVRIVWLDLETTGLNPLSDLILEVGVIVTDGQLRELARFERVLHVPIAVLASMPPIVQTMHAESGLTPKVLASTVTLSDVSYELRAFLAALGVDNTSFLAGNSVGDFDRHFLRVHLPEVNGMISHRSINASTFKALCSLWSPDLAAPQVDRTKPHRSMLDCEHAIRELRYWLDACAPNFDPDNGYPGGFPGYEFHVKRAR